MSLVAVNAYDKLDELDRWVSEVREFLPDWRVRADWNGDRSWSRAYDADFFRWFPNRGPTLGTYDAYKFFTHPGDGQYVVSVHAKTWISDLTFIDRVCQRLGDDGMDALVVPDPSFKPDGINLHMFVVRASLWEQVALAVKKVESDGLWPEVGMSRAISEACPRISRLTPARDDRWVNGVQPDRKDGRSFGARQAEQVEFELVFDDGTRLVSSEDRDHFRRKR